MKKKLFFIFAFCFSSLCFAQNSLSQIKKYSVDVLYSKIRSNEQNVIQAILAKKINLNKENVLGYTVLSYAVIDNDVKIVKMLLENGAKANAGINFPLYELCRTKQKITGRYEVLNLLVSYGANINQQHKNTSLTPLMATIQNQKGEYANYLLQKGAKLNYKNDDGETALMMAIDYSDGKSDNLIKKMIESGADLDIVARNGSTALSIACYKGDSRTVKLLLENKAKTVVSKSQKNEIPILNACYAGSLDCVKLLLKYGADINIKDSYGISCLLLACTSTDNPELVKLCIDNGNDVNYIDPSSGNSAFLLAAIWNHPKQMDELRKNGANIYYQNPEVGSALIFIIKNGNKEADPPYYPANELGGAIHALKNGMFSPLEKTSNGIPARRLIVSELNKAITVEKQEEFILLLDTLINATYKGKPTYTLHEAVILNKIEEIRAYIKTPNNVLTLADVEGYTPLDYAKKYNRKEIEKLLRASGATK